MADAETETPVAEEQVGEDQAAASGENTSGDSIPEFEQLKTESTATGQECRPVALRWRARHADR